jgi:hypothetical protein
MGTQMKVSASAIFIALSFFYAGQALAQDRPAASQVIPLTVQVGVPLRVVLEKPVRIKHAGVPVEGRLLQPIYVFDSMVIPAGSEVLGHVTEVEGVSRSQRMLAIANGDFTPLHKAHLEFDTLVLKDGRRLPLETTVSLGFSDVVHLTAGGESKKKGLVSGTVEEVRQEIKQRQQEAVQAIKAPGKLKRLEGMLSAELPYHRQTLPAGTQFTADLTTPLGMGAKDCAPNELEQLGAAIPPGSTVRARLVTALSSATDHVGSPVEAVVSEPVFSSDRHLILPEGARLEGKVTRAEPAHRLGRNGQLRFTFRKVELPQGATRSVEASLQGVEVSRAAHLKLDTEGGAHATASKTRFVAPAIDVLLATSSLDGLEGHHRAIQEGASESGRAAGGAVRGGAGFGLVGTVIGLIARSNPVSAGFAFYGAAWSVYYHVVARGSDVAFPKDTPMEILFGTHESPAKPAAAGKPPTSGKSKLTNLS